MKHLSMGVLALGLVFGAAGGSAAADEVTTHTGTGKTREMACKTAMDLASSEGASAGECTCQFNGRVHVCRSDTILKDKPGQPVSVELTPVKPGARVVAQRPEQRPAQCNDLIRYRDSQLKDDFNAALARYNVAQDSLAALAPVKQELQRAKLVGPTVDVAYNLVLLLKTSSDLLMDLAGTMPGMQAAKEGATGFAAAALSNEAELGAAVLSGEVDSYLKTQAMALVPGIGPALKATYNLAQNQDALAANATDGKALIASIERQVRQIEALYRKQQELLRNTEVQTKLINRIKNDIDRKCS